jgi:hypothetical protein
MKVADRGSALSRRIVIVLGMLAVLATAQVSAAQDPAAAGQAGAQPDQFLFKSEAGLIQWQVKADKVADFESSWSALRTKLQAAPKPELKTLADNLKMYKSEAAPQNVPGTGNIVTYYFIVDPAATAQSYDPSKLLFETGDLFARAEAEAIFNKLADSLAGIGTVPLKRVQ